MSEEEFWHYKTLGLTAGLEDFGGIKWDITLCYLVGSALVFLCIFKGVKSIGKAVYITALLPYILLTVILVRALFLPGSLDGKLFFITPDFVKLKDVRVWIEAAIQVFYSLGTSGGFYITMASCNRFENNCYRARTGICALLQLPLSNLWAVLFFLMLMSVALDSQFVGMETLVTAINRHFPKLKHKHILVTAFVCIVYFVMGIMLCSRAGIYVYQLLDWYVAVVVPMFALVECLIIGWIYGADQFSKDIQLMIKRPVPIFMRVCWCFVTPILVLVLFIFALISYQPPIYGDYVYPTYVNTIGWIIGILPLAPVFVGGFYTLKKYPGNTVTQRFKSSFRPSNKWKPVSPKHAQGYHVDNYRPSLGLFERIKHNVVGEDMS